MIWYEQSSHKRKKITENRIRHALSFVRDIIEEDYLCKFETSRWSIAELANIIKDDAISIKMFNEGRSLAHFNRYKSDYPFTAEERTEISEIVNDFKKFISWLGVKISPCQVFSNSTQHFATKYALDTSDALHLALSYKKCRYFITNDRHYLQSNPKITEIEVLNPSSLRNRSEIVVEKPTFRKRRIKWGID